MTGLIPYDLLQCRCNSSTQSNNKKTNKKIKITKRNNEIIKEEHLLRYYKLFLLINDR